MPMSYFDSQLGRRPAPRPEEQESKPALPSAQSEPLFGSRLGSRPAPIDQPSATEQPTHQAGVVPWQPAAVCPLCRGPLVSGRGIYRCTGRCGARWLEDGNQLIDLAGLPFGICVCCMPPQPLAESDQGLICPATQTPYLLLPDGALPLAQAAPYGLCQCCAPPVPLVIQGDLLVCQSKPQQRYRRSATGLEQLPPGRASDETLAAIDAALRRNSARLTINGLFDLD